MMTSVQVSNLRLLLASLPAPELAELMGVMADELRTRLQFDAANYVTRAVACLDARRLADRDLSATTEPAAQ
jgi:predicted NAD/FAD-dependent oxidoreductase